MKKLLFSAVCVLAFSPSLSANVTCPLAEVVQKQIEQQLQEHKTLALNVAEGSMKETKESSTLIKSEEFYNVPELKLHADPVLPKHQINCYYYPKKGKLGNYFYRITVSDI